MKNKIIISAISLIFLFFPAKILAQWNPADLAQFNLSSTPIAGIVGNLVTWMLGMLELICFIAFAVSGIIYLTAAGDEDRINKAKKAMTFSIIGIIVGLSGFVIMQAAVYMLGGQPF